MQAPALTVRAVRAVPVKIPMTYALGTSAAIVREAPLLLVDLDTEEDVSGCAFQFCYTPAAAAAIITLLEDAAGAIRGQPLAPETIWDTLSRRYKLIGVQGIVRMAMSMIDIAGWDAQAVAAGVPLVEYLGGTLRPVPAYNSCGLGLMAPAAVADEAEKLLAGGFRAMKLRLGYATLAEDLAAVRAVRKRLPDSVQIMTDYNQALTVDEAIARGRALDGEGIYWIEEPIRHDDYAGCARIAATVETPVQIGENFSQIYDMEKSLAANASDFVMPDLERIGGVTGWRRAAALAQGAGLRMSSHLYPEVSAHLLAVTPTAHWLEYVDWLDAVVNEPLRIVDGHAQIPQRPGNGISWNASAVKKFRMT